MDGQRLQVFWNQEVKSLLAVYRQFETLLPNPKTAGAEHRGEDGRYVETLVRSYLQKYLPKDLEVLTGFILRPAVKLGDNDRSRAKEQDLHTTQLDIVIYDSGTYPVFQRMVDTVIVPPEGVVAVLSVKKTLRDAEIIAECNALLEASKACRCDERNPEARRRGPFLALVATDSDLADKQERKEKRIFEKLETLYGSSSAFDDMIGFIGDLSAWHVFKTRPPPKLNPMNKFAKYMYVELSDAELHQGFQFLLSGILSVYYDKTRTGVRRPGFTAFAAKPATEIGKIAFSSLR
ncbi:MAG: DUF6602 domain-containing protein [Allorhizobium sp.]